MVSNGGHERGPRRGEALPARYTTLSFRTEQADFILPLSLLRKRRLAQRGISLLFPPSLRLFFSVTLSGRDQDTLSLVAR